MSTTETVAPPRQEQDPGPRRRRGRILASVLTAMGIGLVVWWQLTVPNLEGGGSGGVSSSDHEIVMGTGMDKTVYVVPADTAGETLLAFEIRNAGRLPVELVDVWPAMDEPHCLWQPSRREFRDDPRTMYTWDGPSRPVAGAVLPPGDHAMIWLTGALRDPDRCEYSGGFGLHEDVGIVASIGGRTSTTRVPLGYSFGYGDEPHRLEDSFGVDVIPPREPLHGE